ncbi:MAG: DUF2975 domain-containing protein [Gammaproteobacteria bacterium]|nr:DUF2975 domain-containing protein [Gammaproteobacteria bacterium]MBU2546368.1 DUF2975 domain-containing protein [Gammaproteobacteria bacterium]
MNKIATVSRKFRILFQILFYLTPLTLFIFWITFHTPYDFFNKLGITVPIMQGGTITVNGLTRILGFIVSMLPGSIFMYCLHQLARLLSNYEKGQIFIMDNINRYRKLGYALFAWVFCRALIYEALISLVLSFQNTPPHKKFIMVGLSSFDLIALVTGGVILLISWVMKEAHQISKDQELTI